MHKEHYITHTRINFKNFIHNPERNYFKLKQNKQSHQHRQLKYKKMRPIPNIKSCTVKQTSNNVGNVGNVGIGTDDFLFCSTPMPAVKLANIHFSMRSRLKAVNAPPISDSPEQPSSLQNHVSHRGFSVKKEVETLNNKFNDKSINVKQTMSSTTSPATTASACSSSHQSAYAYELSSPKDDVDTTSLLSPAKIALKQKTFSTRGLSPKQREFPLILFKNTDDNLESLKLSLKGTKKIERNLGIIFLFLTLKF